MQGFYNYERWKYKTVEQVQALNDEYLAKEERVLYNAIRLYYVMKFAMTDEMCWLLFAINEEKERRQKLTA